MTECISDLNFEAYLPIFDSYRGSLRSRLVSRLSPYIFSDEHNFEINSFKYRLLLIFIL